MSTHAFHCIDPESIFYPRPTAAVLPYLSYPQWVPHPVDLPYFLTIPHSFFKNARTSLAYVLKGAGSSKPDVLVPGYICKSLVEPIIWAGYRPVFYKLNRDLSVDLDDFKRKSRHAGAAIATHFFGMPQPIDELVTICDQTNVLLIEDCAHALFGEHRGQPLGSFGDFAIASTVKFCPGVEGGILVRRNRQPVSEDGVAAAGPASLRSFALILQTSAQQHLAALRRAHCAIEAGDVPEVPAWRGQRVHDTDTVPDDRGRYEYFNPEDVNTKGDGLSYRLLFHLDYTFIKRKRRENFAIYAASFAGVRNCRPLFTNLPDAMVPYMFPLYVENTEWSFRELKYAGIPIWRWEQQHVLAPELAIEYGYRLLHLPCHQCLREEDIKQICARIAAIITKH